MSVKSLAAEWTWVPEVPDSPSDFGPSLDSAIFLSLHILFSLRLSDLTVDDDHQYLLSVQMLGMSPPPLRSHWVCTNVTLSQVDFYFLLERLLFIYRWCLL